ncbi:hypothetical protein EC988_000387 [Linderina pennispora]|nr:hypothetical protein EC988_000387 [Linderina pennispora]
MSTDNTHSSSPVAEHRSCPPVDTKRNSLIDFGGLQPYYYMPIRYPTEVSLYEQTVSASNSVALPSSGQQTVRAQVDLPMPCGYFNVWRPLHDQSLPISPRLVNYFPGEASQGAAPRLNKENSTAEWDSRISYSSADDEYYQNGRALPFIKGFAHGALSHGGVFRKVEHDWMMSYLAPTYWDTAREASFLAWRFNYVVAKRPIDRFMAVLSWSKFDATSSVQWSVRALSQLEFTKIPTYVLSADEAKDFPEIPGNEGAECDLERRARTIAEHRGHLLAYVGVPANGNDYIQHTVPGFAADLTQYVQGEYGFEIAVAFYPATSGPNEWQKAQVARQPLRTTVAGRTSEGEQAMERCGLDFRVKLRDDIPIGPQPPDLKQALLVAGKSLQMDGQQCDFEIVVADPQNTVGALQPLIRAHSHVLAAGSEYFSALQASNMTESEARRVELEDMPYGHVRRAIYFIYNDMIPTTEYMDSTDDWLQLLDVAARLAIPRLAQRCQAELLRIASTVGSDALTFDTTDLVLPDEQDDSSRIIFHNYPKVSFGDYTQLVQYPDPEYIESLIGLVADAGADDLVAALQRLLVYYPIGVCEDRMRAADTRQFQGPDEDRENSFMFNDMFALPHMVRPAQEADDEAHRLAHFLGAMPGPVVHPPHVGVRDHEPMDGNDEEEEHAQPGLQGILDHVREWNGFRHLWMPVQVPGNAAQQNNDQGDEEPPQPQPGPVPEPPTRTQDE